MIELNDIEESEIYRLNQMPELMSALKKVFLNTFIRAKSLQRDNVSLLAAQRIAIDLLEDSFEELAKIRPKEEGTSEGINPAI